MNPKNIQSHVPGADKIPSQLETSNKLTVDWLSEGETNTNIYPASVICCKVNILQVWDLGSSWLPASAILSWQLEKEYCEWGRGGDGGDDSDVGDGDNRRGDDTKAERILSWWRRGC